MPDAPVRSVAFGVKDSADVLLGMRQVQVSGLLEGADAVDATLVGTIVSELASNIVKYAQRGFVKVQRTEAPDGIDIDVWAEDQGPGIGDMDLALSDRFSTGGTLGLGLPAVQRLSDEFSIRSVVGRGTEVHAKRRIAGRRRENRPAMIPAPAARPGPWEIGIRARPATGQAVCGDVAMAVQAGDGLLLAVVDATGHGSGANAAAKRAAETLLAGASADLPGLLAALHRALTGTNGAAIGLLHLDPAGRAFRYAGVGNTGAARRVGAPWRGISKDGMLGQRLPTPMQQDGILSAGDLFALWTDGVSEGAIGPFVTANAGLPAAAIARQAVDTLGRPHDDAACIALRWTG